MKEEEKYLEIREKLMNLPKLKASEGFMAKLQREINIIDAEETQSRYSKEKTSGGFFQYLFGRQNRPWLVPASGLAIVLIIAGIFYFSPKSDVMPVAETQTESTGQELSQETRDEKPVTANDMKEMKKDEGSESLADNQTEAKEDLSLTQTAPVSTERTSTVQTESRVRPEIKIATEDETEKIQETEKKISDEFKTSTAIDNMGAVSKGEERLSNANIRRGDTSKSLRSRRSPVQVSTIRQVELESLKEKVSDQ